MKWKNILLITGGILVILVVIAAVYLYPSYKFFFSENTIRIDKDFLVVQGGGGNSGLLVSDNAVVVIDTKMGGDAKKLYKQASERAGSKHLIVINTHFHGDHVKGNYLYKGSPIYIGAYDMAFLRENMAEENLPDHFVKDSLVIDLGNESLSLYNLGQAHTWNDMVVLLNSRGVLFTGDLVFDRINPFLMRKSGADVDKWIAALDRILSIPGVTVYVPGHGKPGDRALVETIKTYFIDMKTAADDPSKEKVMKEKYKDWMEMPMATSPGITIDYIRSSN